MITDRINAVAKTWWLARSGFVRTVVKLLLGLVVGGGMLLFLSFESRRHFSQAVGEELHLTIGAFRPWYVLGRTNTITATATTSSSAMHQESHINYFSLSFLAGVVALLALEARLCIWLWEKRQKDQAAISQEAGGG